MIERTLECCIHLFRRYRNSSIDIAETGIIDEVVALGTEYTARFGVNACNAKRQRHKVLATETWSLSQLPRQILTEVVVCAPQMFAHMRLPARRVRAL